MNTNAPILVMMSKICTAIALVGFLFLVISSLALEDAGLFIAFIVSAFAALIGIVSIIAILATGVDRTGSLMLMLVINIVLLVIYTCIIVYVGFIVPTAVNATMNG